MEKYSLIELAAGCYLIQHKGSFTQSQLSKWTFAKQTVLISLDVQLVPFLSLKDNLLLGIKRKQQVSITDYFQKSQLSMALLDQSIEQLSNLERIQFQILKQLMQQKNCLILDHCDEALSIKETQELLMFCRRIALNYQVSIILISGDEQLAQTPYLEQLLN